MILRIRTNLGMTKITIDNEQTTTLQQLLKLIVEKLNISNPSQSLQLTYDLVGDRPLVYRSLQQSLKELGLKHGDELFIKGKFEEVIVEKSFINDQHELIQAGKSLKLIKEEGEEAVKGAGEEKGKEKGGFSEGGGLKVGTGGGIEPQKKESNREESAYHSEPVKPVAAPPELSPALVVAKPSHLAAKANPSKATIEDTKPSSTATALKGPSTVPTKAPPPSIIATAPMPSNATPMKSDDFIEQEGVRAPDQVQKMTLLDFPSPSRDFSPKEIAQLNQSREQLREAGLKEYEIEKLIQEMKDEMFAERLRRQMNIEDRLSNQRFTQLEELEQLIASHQRLPYTASVPSGVSQIRSIYRPDYTGARGSGSNKRKFIDELRAASEDPTPSTSIPPLNQQPSSSNGSKARSNKLKGAGERILQNSADPEVSSSNNVRVADARKKPINTFNSPSLTQASDEEEEMTKDVELVDEETAPSLKGSSYKPISSYRGSQSNRRNQSNSSSIPVSSRMVQATSQGESSLRQKKSQDAEFEEMMRQAIEQSRLEAEKIDRSTSQSSAPSTNNGQPSSKTKRQSSASSTKPSSSERVHRTEAVANPQNVSVRNAQTNTTTSRSRPSSHTKESSSKMTSSSASSQNSTVSGITKMRAAIRKEKESGGKPSAEKTETKEDENAETLLKIQEELDAEAARELQELEDRIYAYDQDGREILPGINSESSVLRRVLHDHQPLPSRLNQEMNEDMTQDLVRLAQERTAIENNYLYPPFLMREPEIHHEFIFPQLRPEPPPIIPSVPYYEEDDELFARALQNSLNEK